MRYIIQRYERCSYYEPAEGGYYYAGKHPDDYYEVFETKELAVAGLRKIVEDYNQEVEIQAEGFLILSPNGLHAFSINHSYIGDGEEFYVEPINRRGRHREGRQVYQ